MTLSSVITRMGPEPIRSEQTERWLLGLPSLSRLLQFSEDQVPKDLREPRAALAEAWQRANDCYQELEDVEAGIANHASRLPLPSALEAYGERVRRHPYFQLTFDTLPTAIEMVPLDLLIAHQRHVTWSSVVTLASRLRRSLDDLELARLCLPLDAPGAPVQVQQIGGKRYRFRSPSTDFRFLQAACLGPGQLADVPNSGPVANAVGLMVGFGCNFLNAVRVGNRLLLNNGYHRVCALRAVGVTHAPCVVQTATRVEELAVVSRDAVVEQAEFYFESARPPLMRDFFDPRLSRDLPCRLTVREIEITFEVKEHLVDA